VLISLKQATNEDSPERAIILRAVQRDRFDIDNVMLVDRCTIKTMAHTS
jgi:hypothetical protein